VELYIIEIGYVLVYVVGDGYIDARWIVWL